MELKLLKKGFLDDGKDGSNRTFMELKFGYSLLQNIKRHVLIAPLWN